MSRSARFGVWLVVFTAALVVLVPSSEAGPGYVNFVLGQKLFDSEDWDPIDKQPVFGVEAAFGPSTWPVHIMTFLQRSSKSKDQTVDVGGTPVAVTMEADTWEFGAGVNKTWMAGKLYPYVGAGLDYAKVDVTFKEGGTSASDDGNGFGFWGGAGAFYRIGTRFNLGGTMRYSTANADFNAFDTGAVEFGGADIDAGGLTFGFLVGWGWPATP
ncbi:MAG TPA: outer membrane beta-barrel protein [Candidatus Eisenbacteria bacterium]|nr:outer membrane beta-barrel protein [Candidatus Eisenbacteria bacterium]